MAKYERKTKKKEKCCRTCGLEFSEENKNLFLWQIRYRSRVKTEGTLYFYPDCKICYNKAKRAKEPKINKATKYIRELKNSTPCKDCGKNYPYYVMQFDHLRDKKFNIGIMSPSITLEVAKAEIEKCEIVCANCHYARTYNRRLNK